MNLTTEIRKAVREEVKSQIDELRKLIMGRGIIGAYVKQDMACIMLGIKKRQLMNLRVHLNKEKVKVGCIRWRKSRGKYCEYLKADIEKYLNHITVH